MEQEDHESLEQKYRDLERGDPENMISKIIDGMYSYLHPAYLPHVMAVLESVPLTELQKLFDGNVALFAIDPNFLGLVLDPRTFDGPIIYLSPQLVLDPARPESEIRAIIANEFTHVVLNHVDPEESTLDKLAKITDGMFSYLDSAYLLHVTAVLNQVPINLLEEFSNSQVALFAIDPNHIGEVLPPRKFDGPMIYLSPQLLSLPENEIRGTIAHEFAHVALNDEARPDEAAADRLAESWGFPLPQSYRDRL